MRRHEAERCSTVHQKAASFVSFSLRRNVTPAREARRAALAMAAIAAVVAAGASPPGALPESARAAAGFGWHVFVNGASIIMESAPFVLAGCIAASCVQRFALLAPLTATLVLLNPGCDCSQNGFADALRRSNPATAGFALTWGAVCAPMALVTTHAILGDRALVARLIGGAVAASVTALAWSRAGAPQSDEPACGHPATSLAEHFGRAICGIAVAALAAALLIGLLKVAPALSRFVSSPIAAAFAGSLLSPCSTADAVIARVFTESRPAQAVFMVAAQCADIRQFGMLRRSFGLSRAVLAMGAGIAGCVAAAIAGR
jgi:hypothetical protein